MAEDSHPNALPRQSGRVQLLLSASKQVWGAGGRLIAHLALFSLILIASVRAFLFGSGLVIYQNWSWPISDGHVVPALGVFNPSLWGNTGPDAAGFTRVASDWPPFMIAYVSHSTRLLEVGVFVWEYALTYAVAFVAAMLFLRLFFPDVGGASKEYVRAGFILLFFINPAALQWESGALFSFQVGAPLLCVVLLATQLWIKDGSARLACVAGLALGLSATLDPRLAVWGAFGVLVLVLLGLLTRRQWRATFRNTVWLGLAAAPGLLATYYAYAWADTLSGPPVGPLSLASLNYFSSNSGGLQVLELMGYYITGVYYAPPSVYGYQSQLGSLATLGHPGYAVVTPDLVFGIWSVTLVALPVLVFASLLFRRYLDRTLPLAAVLLASLTSAAGTKPGGYPTAVLEVTIARVHLGGFQSVWQTVVGVPIYIQVLSEAICIPLALVSSISLIRRVRNSLESPRRIWHANVLGTTLLIARLHPTPRRGADRAVAVTAIVIAGMLGFGGWQFFTGSFYPGGLSPGVSPNEVPDVGALQPGQVPGADVAIYNYIQARGVLPGAVFWPGANSFSYPWNPKWSPSIGENAPTAVQFPVGLRTLMVDNLPIDIAALLTEYGVRFLVIDNMSSAAMEYNFGVQTAAQVNRLLSAAAGMEELLSYPGTAWLYENIENQGIVTLHSQLVYPLIPPEGYGEVLGAIQSAGWSVSLAKHDEGTLPTLGYGSTNSTGPAPSLAVVSAANLSSQGYSMSIEGFSSSASSGGPLVLRGTGEARLPSPNGNWTASVWSYGGQPINLVGLPNGTLSMAENGSPSSISINFRSSLVNGFTNGIRVNPNSIIEFRVAATVSSNSTLSSAYLNVVASNSSAINIAQFNSPRFPLSTQPRQIVSTGSLPYGSAYWTLRLFLGESGQVLVRNVSLQWTQLLETPAAFGGVGLQLNGTSLAFIPTTVGGGGVEVDSQVMGNGTISLIAGSTNTAKRFTSGGFEWVDLASLSPDAPVHVYINGSVTFAGAVVSAIPRDQTPPASLRAVEATGYAIAGVVTSESGGYLQLNYPYVSDWQLYLNGSRSVSPTPDGTGSVVFQLPVGTFSFRLELRNVGFNPIIISALGSYFVIGLLLLSPWGRSLLPRRQGADTFRRTTKSILQRDRR